MQPSAVPAVVLESVIANPRLWILRALTALLLCHDVWHLASCGHWLPSGHAMQQRDVDSQCRCTCVAAAACVPMSMSILAFSAPMAVAATAALCVVERSVAFVATVAY